MLYLYKNIVVNVIFTRIKNNILQLILIQTHYEQKRRFYSTHK
jgi:hypothetical protein